MTTTEIVQSHDIEVSIRYDRSNVFATLLYGSQNYSLATLESDVDTKAMILPTLHALALNTKLISTEHTMPDGGLCNVKDVRLMFGNFLKSNINFLETLFTNYRAVNPTFRPFWNELYAARHMIANANPLRLMHATAGMAQQKYIAMERPFESKAEVLAKHGYDPKQLVHLVRLSQFMESYLEYSSFAACLVPEPTNHNYLLSLKINPPPLEEARLLREYSKEKVDALLQRANNLYAANPFSAVEAKDFLEDLSYRLIYSHIATEFKS